MEETSSQLNEGGFYAAYSRSFPQAIIHVDGDSFFASCEMANNPSLRGKAVVTGEERGIATSMSYEAKKRGVHRGMRMFEIRKVCPEAIIVSSDYESYALYARRMYDIVRRFTPEVEEYSIDECFANITGLRNNLHMPYPKIAEKIKEALEGELGMTFSVGLSVNKVMAKVASKWKKPSGLTIIPSQNISTYLEKLPAGKIWGIGPNTNAHLNRFKVNTALEFASKNEAWVKNNLSKPYEEIWRELKGEYVFVLDTSNKEDYKSITKSRTFSPPTTDKDFIFSQLSKNVESACAKLRAHGLYVKEITFFLKKQTFRYSGLEIKLGTPLCVPQILLNAIKDHFDEVYEGGVFYRATGIVLRQLQTSDDTSLDLFGGSSVIEKITKVYEKVDEMERKFGRNTLFLGSSAEALKHQEREDKEMSDRKMRSLLREGNKKNLNIPSWGKIK